MSEYRFGDRAELEPVAKVQAHRDKSKPFRSLSLAFYFMRSRINVRVTFTPLPVVVLKVIVRWSPEIVKWRSIYLSLCLQAKSRPQDRGSQDPYRSSSL
jgi:hypothetical protein